MIEELKKILNESEDINKTSPYEREEDESLPHYGEKRKKVLTLGDLNRLKRIRNQKREEIAQDSAFIPVLYGPSANPEDESGMMGGMM
jgi:hypothetical protein